MSKTGGRAAAEQAETLALRALAYIAADEDRFVRFLASSGTTPDDVRRRAADPAFLAGVYDHLLADEALLVAFAEAADIAPEKIAAARFRLPGAVMD